MTTRELPAYELPPFELIKLIQPAFQASSAAPGPSHHALGVGSPEALNLSAAALSPPGPASPLNIGSSAAAAAGGGDASTTLSGRLSQLVGKNGALSSSPSSRPMSPGAAAATSTGLASSPSGVTSPELRANRLAPAHGVDSPPSFAFGAGQVTSGGSAPSTSAGRGAQTIRSVEAGAESVWVAGSEGSVAVWKLDADRASIKGKGRAVDAQNEADIAEEAAYLLDQYNVVPGRRPVEKLAVLPTVGKAVILSEGILTLHSLPTFTVLPAFAPIRGVSTFAVDLSDPHADAVHVCVIRRKSMQLLSISHSTVDLLKELPLRTTAILAVLRGRFLCIADAVNYSLVDVSSATLTPLLPISQDPPDSPPSEMHDLTPSSMPAAPSRPKSHQRPSILPIEKNEFLIASHTGYSTLGLFIKENGEPTRGTLEWPSNPKSLCVDYPYIVALLHNNTMELHSILTQELVQVLQLSSLSLKSLSPPNDPSQHLSPSPATKAEKIQPRFLASTSAGFPSRLAGQVAGDPSFAPLLVPQIGSHNSLEKVPVRFSLRPHGADTAREFTAPKQEGPPSTPKKGSALTATRPPHTREQTRYVSTIASKTLLVGRDSIFALCTVTLVVQAEALVMKNRIEDALNLLEAVGPPNTPEKLNEFCYIKQKAFWQLLTETRFSEAGRLLLDARMDPRLLIRLFPDVAGRLYDKVSHESLLVYRGLRDVFGDDTLNHLTIDGIIRNYSPHLPPSSPSVSNLHTRLEKDARRMLRDFLVAWRTERRANGLTRLGFPNSHDSLIKDLDMMVDTALAKLYLDDIKGTEQLLSMLEREAHDCDVDELATLLEKHSLHWYLSQLLLLEHRIPDTLIVWTELIDGKRQDSRFTGGIQKVFNLLENTTDSTLVKKYGLWLVGHDRNLGIQLLTKPAQGVQIDIEECLRSLRLVDSEAADLFLEHAVFTKRNAPKDLHNELAVTYLDKLSTLLENTSLREDIRLSRKDYATNVNTSEVTIVSYTLSKFHASESMAVRGKLVLLLHGSPVVDMEMAQRRLKALPELLFEGALVSGRLGLHFQVLFTLANDLLDLASAEAYCTHAGNGDVLTARNIREIVASIGLSPFPSALFRKDGRRKHSLQQSAMTLEDKEEKRLELLNTLIKIQLERVPDSSESAARDQQRTAHVIETQAIRISAKEILPSIPADWPLPLMEGFLIRNMRRTLHERYERKLVKALLQTQTLETSLRYWDLTERLGGVVAEEADDDYDDTGSEEAVVNEKAYGLDERDSTYGLDERDSTDGVVLVSSGRPYLDDEKTVEL